MNQSERFGDTAASTLYCFSSQERRKKPCMSRAELYTGLSLFIHKIYVHRCYVFYGKRLTNKPLINQLIIIMLIVFINFWCFSFFKEQIELNDNTVFQAAQIIGPDLEYFYKASPEAERPNLRHDIVCKAVTLVSIQFYILSVYLYVNLSSFPVFLSFMLLYDISVNEMPQLCACCCFYFKQF